VIKGFSVFVLRVWLSHVIFHWLKQILTKVTLTDYNWSIQSNWPIKSDQDYQKCREPAHSARDKNVYFCFYLWLVGSVGCPTCSGRCLWFIIPIWQVKPKFQGSLCKDTRFKNASGVESLQTSCCFLTKVPTHDLPHSSLTLKQLNESGWRYKILKDDGLDLSLTIYKLIFQKLDNFHRLPQRRTRRKTEWTKAQTNEQTFLACALLNSALTLLGWSRRASVVSFIANWFFKTHEQKSNQSLIKHDVNEHQKVCLSLKNMRFHEADKWIVKRPL